LPCGQVLPQIDRGIFGGASFCAARRPEDGASAMYEWIKAVHVIAVISWMAGMLYLPRLFVYHCEAEAGSTQSETFKLMERRLLKAIINPAMIITWLAGIYLAWAGHWYLSPWFHAKFVLVLLLSAVHGFFAGGLKPFSCERSHIAIKGSDLSFCATGCSPRVAGGRPNG